MISLVDLIDHVFAIKTCYSCNRIWQIVISKLCTGPAGSDIINNRILHWPRSFLIASLVTSISVIPVKQVKTNKSRLHTKEDHDFWIQRNGFCPYCNSGSTPVPKKHIVEGLR